MTTFFHISDVHFGIEDRVALDWFARAVAEEGPDGILLTGDITQRAKHREYAAAEDWLRALNTPVMLEVGNHDMPYYNPIERARTPFKRYDRLKAAVGSDLSTPELAIVPLLTTIKAQPRWPWSDGWITDEALQATLDALDALPDEQPKMVIGHHPLPERRDDGKLLTKGGDRAMAELASRNVRAMLSGHVHKAFDQVAETPGGPLRMIGTGTLSQRLRGAPPAYRVIHWDGSDIASELREKPADL